VNDAAVMGARVETWPRVPFDHTRREAALRNCARGSQAGDSTSDNSDVDMLH
jgi:hypothetical protein